MKIVKEGRPQKGWAKEFKCTGKGNGDGGCGAVLLVEKGDLFHTYRSFMGREEEWYTTFECPCCKVLTDIQTPFQSSELPHYKEWKSKLPESNYRPVAKGNIQGDLLRSMNHILEIYEDKDNAMVRIITDGSDINLEEIRKIIPLTVGIEIANSHEFMILYNDDRMGRCNTNCEHNHHCALNRSSYSSEQRHIPKLGIDVSPDGEIRLVCQDKIERL